MAKGKYHEWLTPEGLTLLEGWARDGLTDEQIAGNMGVNRATLYDWKKRYSDISDTLKSGKEVVDRAVENALLKRAMGYRYEEVTKETGTIEDEESGELKRVMVETKRVTKEVQPDVTAQIFWLKNRKPDVWRDKQQVDLTGDLTLKKLEDLM
ncbi:transposase [Paenibacillus odorifer]|uniref:helix-turn-helix domain-containing protein n=1 Tax=Paenibacillus odorifer TaxID=189426 RepID=UPI00096F8DA3|nr:helix-turn-helix domain-containing protein [Paenibacillus odorifer]OMD92996.1 transposase [Paenibacillus odorifer]